MTILLGTLCLNEMEHLPRLYQQHKDWPGLTRWVFVEAADQVYAETNPDMVSPAGLSVDGTSAFLSEIAARDPRVVYIPHGFSKWGDDPTQFKCQARNRYLEIADQVEPTWICVLDADEYYIKSVQAEIPKMLAQRNDNFTGFIFRQRHIWRPVSIADKPLFELEAMGAYWGVVHCRFWRYLHGMRHSSCHNSPNDRTGSSMGRHSKKFRFDYYGSSPDCIHLGFASGLKQRRAKHLYYQARGEGRIDRRQMYVNCRKAFEEWKPGDVLPHRAVVVPYVGPIPEVFKEQTCNPLLSASSS